MSETQIIRKIFILLFLCIFSLNSFAEISYRQTENEFIFFDSNNEKLKLCFDIEQNDFIQFEKVKFNIHEKLGSYKSKTKTLSKSYNLSIDTVLKSSHRIDLKISFDFGKKRESANIQILSEANGLIVNVLELENLDFNRVLFSIKDDSKAIFGGGIQFSHCNLV